MFENTNNEDAIPATLVEGEAVISAEYIEKNKEAIEELVEKYKEASQPKETPKPQETKKKSELPVAIHSTRNVTWEGVGKVYIGYNIVTPENADKWLTRNHTRLATPQEVAKEFGL
jgi:dsRNA-specific ribonuclease